MPHFPVKKRVLLKALAHESEGGEGRWFTAEEAVVNIARGGMRHEMQKAIRDLEQLDQMPVNEEDLTMTNSLVSGTGPNLHEMKQILDELARDGLLERRELPAVQYRRVMKPMPWSVDEVRQIVSSRGARLVMSGYAEEGVVLMDQITASLLIKLYDNLSASNQQKFASRDVIEATHLAWKMVERGSVSATR